jgi:flavin reductase (DIM6/NTAB) family NADH-FMN oxidoreductase RutF
MPATFAQSPPFGPDSPLYRPPVHFLRGSLGRFATGVAVVSFAVPNSSPAGAGKYRGVTVNSFTSVSMNPPLILVALQRTVPSHDLLRGRRFTVNVLGAEQRELALHFAGKPRASLQPAWTEGEHAPRLAGSLCYFECTPWAEYDGGDHTLFLGEVQHFDYRDGDALGFVNGQFTLIPQSVPGHEVLL